MADGESDGMTLAELAVRFGCTLQGEPAVRVRRTGTLEHAGPDAITFLVNPKYRKHLAATRAAAVVLDAKSAADCPVPALVARNPYATYARIAAVLHPPRPVAAGAHPTAVIDASARVDASAAIGAHAVLAAGVSIGPRTVVGPGCVLGHGVTVGADTRLVANVTLCDGVSVGERCMLFPGVVIGADGFGLAPDRGEWVRIPQVGSVRIGNDVDIGANTTIDRGAIEDTVIEDGVKLDNQIQVGHNVRIGAHTAVAACTGISGSAVIGRHCIIAGMVGIAGHLSICDNVQITGKTMVSSSITQPGVYSGKLPMDEAAAFRKNAARFRHLDELVREVRRLGGRSQGAGKPDEE